MMNGLLFVLTLLAALGCAMMAGVFFAFSAFVMKALARLPAELGVAAMQAINVAAVTFAFMADTLRDRGGLWSLGGVGAVCVGRRPCPVPPRRQRAVPRRYDPADDRLPRAAKRSTGDRRATWRLRREPLETLPLGLDRVEPRTGRGCPRGGGYAHDRAPFLEELGRADSIEGVVKMVEDTARSLERRLSD